MCFWRLAFLNTGAKAHIFLDAVRGAEAPLFHGIARIRGDCPAMSISLSETL
jgi:hypothetical protein